MLYFTLPNYAEFYKVNNLLLYVVTDFESDLRYPDILIESSNMVIPYCSLNGGINNNVGKGMVYTDFAAIAEGAPLIPRINFANVLLEPYDYYDNLGNTILQIFDNGSSLIEISSIPFMEYIQSIYPNYEFIFSKWADTITPFTPELLEQIIKTNQFLSVGIPNQYTYNIDWLKQLKYKNKCEITIDPICYQCDQCNSCFLSEQENALEYSGKSLLLHCEKNQQYKYLSLEDIKQHYQPLGFTHFVFEADYMLTPEQKLMFYIKYFFKDEAQNKILQTILMNEDIKNA